MALQCAGDSRPGLPSFARACAAAAGACLACAAAWAAEAPAPKPPPPKPVLFLAAGVVRPVSAPALEPGAVIVVGDKIAAVGGPEHEPPPNAKVLRFPGKVLIPGLIDAATSTLLHKSELDWSLRADPACVAGDGIDCFDPAWKDAVREGVAAAYVSLGPRGAVAGSGTVIRLGGGLPGPELVLLSPAQLEAAICPGASSFTASPAAPDYELTIDIGLSEPGDGEPEYDDPRPDDDTEIILRVGRTPAPSRAGATGFDLLRGYRALRDYLERGRAYRRARAWFDQDMAAWEREVSRLRKEEAEAQAQGKPAVKRPLPPRPAEPRPDAVGAALAPVLEGAARLRVWAEREEEIRCVLALGAEYEIKLVICGAVEAYRVAGELAAADAQVVLVPRAAGVALGADVRGSPRNARALFDAGIQFGFGTGVGPRAGAHLLRHMAACEIAGGLDPDYVLRTVTLTNAEISGVADRTGSIAPGKEANLAVFDGPPFATGSKVLCAVVAGKIVVQEGGDHAPEK